MWTPELHSSMPSSQRGIAAILLVVLIAIALTATSLGMMHSVRSTQAKHVAVHAATHVQTGAWAGVEAFRNFLEQVDEVKLLGMDGMDPESFILPGETVTQLNVRDVSVAETAPGSGTYIVQATIVNSHADAKASSAIGVTYEVTPGYAPSSVPATSIDFRHDLDLDGGLTLIGVDGVKPNLNVEGNIDIDQVNVTELGQLNATGTVYLGSGVSAEKIYSNGDVTIKDSVTVNDVRTLGNFTALAGLNSATVVWANGTVDIDSSGYFDQINSRGDVTLRRGTFGSIRTGGEVIKATFGEVDHIAAVGDIDLQHDTPIGRAVSMGDITCGVDYLIDFEEISANGSVTGCSQEEGLNISSGRSNSVVPMGELTPFVMDPTIIDVWTLKGDANYVIEYDEVNARIKVTVNNVNGLVDGTEYFLANYDWTVVGGYHNNYLCSAADENGYCIEPAVPTAPLCVDFAVENSGCISYSVADEKFNLQGKGAAPGIMWFKGNINLSSSENQTTFLVTGNVTSSGSLKIHSVNYAGFDGICLADNSMLEGDEHTLYEERFGGQYPTNLCTMDTATTGTYNPIDTGNIGIAAGGFDTETGDGLTFSGGNIDLTAYNEIWGAVLAGGFLKTSGESIIYGAVSAAVQGEKGEEKNHLGASTTVDLTKGTDTYDPNAIPNMGGGPGTGPVSTGSNTAKMLWSKYL